MGNDQDYSLRSFAWLDNSNPEQSCWRTSQHSLFEEWEAYSESWPRSGLMQNGTASRLPELVRLTDVIGCSSLPTPNTMDHTGTGRMNKNANVKKWGGVNSLGGMAATGMWPTPQASDNRDRGCMEGASVKRRIKMGKQIGLSTAVKEKKTTGTLNPTWVEWLMGFPIGWTDLNA